MKKLNDKQYEEYWRTTHCRGKEDICCVCFPDKPRFFNLFFDRIQKRIIKKYLKKEKIVLDGVKMLDVGCGRGRWLQFFKFYGVDIVGIDLSEEAVSKCGKKGLRAYTGSIADMDMFQKQEFDMVTSITVLLHLPYDIKKNAIEEIGRVLKKGGKAILIENTWDDPSPHVFSYSVDEWEKVFKECGMKMIHCSGHCFNFCRRKFPCYIKWVEALAIFFDYPLDFLFMELFYGKRTSMGLQHFMVFEK